MIKSLKRTPIIISTFILLTIIIITIIVLGSNVINAASPSNGGTYLFVNRHSGLVLEVANGSVDDGANVQQWGENGHNCQKWRLESTGNGYYHITNVNSGKYFEVQNASTEGGGNIVQYGNTGHSCQEWSFQSAGSGYYILVNRNSGMAADVWGWSKEMGGNIAQWTNTGGANQQWMLVETSATSSSSSSSSSSSGSSSSSSNEVTCSGSTWTARANGNVVYTGNRMFDAVNAACNGAGNNATINIKNSGNSGNDGGNVYAIKPLAGQKLNFNGCTINCNSNGDLAVPIYADRRNNITIQNLRVTGNPRYGVWFRGCSNVTLTNITMNLSNNNPVGLGIRVDASTGSASNLTINGTTTITGSAGHGIETYSINGVTIGNVTVNNTGGCGVILNNSTNCKVGVITGDRNCTGGGYATFRVANTNGSTYCEGVYSRNSGRGFFSVSGSRDCTIGWVDIANTSSHGIFLEDATNTHIQSGYVSNGNPNIQHVRCSNCSTDVNGVLYTANDGRW